MPLLKKATILFDLVHNEILNIDEKDFSQFLGLLEGLSVKIKKNETKDLTEKLLSNVDILVIGNPVDDYFSNLEIRDITDFVREGGGLLLVSEYGADFLQKTNVNDISGKYFGMYFEKNIIKEDNVLNNNCKSILSVQNLTNHKTMDHVRDLIIGGSCSIVLQKTARPIVESNETAWIEMYNPTTNQWIKNVEIKRRIIAATSEYGRGKIVSVGDMDIFTNDENFGLNKLDNSRFILNILNWLIEPTKDADVMFWILEQIGSFQNVMKDMNSKITNIIETMTFLEKRISDVEAKTADDYKKVLEKKKVQEQRSTFI